MYIHIYIYVKIICVNIYVYAVRVYIYIHKYKYCRDIIKRDCWNITCIGNVCKLHRGKSDSCQVMGHVTHINYI